MKSLPFYLGRLVAYCSTEYQLGKAYKPEPVVGSKPEAKHPRRRYGLTHVEYAHCVSLLRWDGAAPIAKTTEYIKEITDRPTIQCYEIAMAIVDWIINH